MLLPGFVPPYPTADILTRATRAYTAYCQAQGRAPAPISPVKSRLSEHFVELRTGANGKLGIFFPATEEFLEYLPSSH